jgi:hypothetical protein
MVISINPDHNYDNYFGFVHAMAATWSGTPGAARIFFQFDYSSIPSHAIITSAKLKLYADTINGTISGFPNGHVSQVGTNEIYIKRITSAWDETLITWNNQPSFDNVNRLKIPASTSISQAYVIDITKFTQAEIAQPNQNYGIMIHMKNESPYRAVAFRSSDDTLTPMLRPELEIKYSE